MLLYLKMVLFNIESNLNIKIDMMYGKYSSRCMLLITSKNLNNWLEKDLLIKIKLLTQPSLFVISLISVNSFG